MNRLATLQRRLLYSALGLLLATGGYWALVRYLGVHPWLNEPLLMKIHGGAAMAALVLIGGLVPGHVAIGWALRRSQPSGTALLATCALLTVTGFLLYYTGDEAARDASSYVHLALGIFLPIVLGAHLVANPSCQPAANPAASQPPPGQQKEHHEAPL